MSITNRSLVCRTLLSKPKRFSTISKRLIKAKSLTELITRNSNNIYKNDILVKKIANFSTIGNGKFRGMVGFIGLGQMGSQMAKNLLKAGIDLTVYDNDSEKLKEFPKSSQSLESMISNCQRIITMLPNNDAVEKVYLGDKETRMQGLKDLAKPGSIFIDCSTVSPDLEMKISKEYEKKGLGFIDAPVSGGVKGAQQGTLSFLVGGSTDLIESQKDLLLAMGKRVFPCGAVGSGQVAKICNNLILGVSMVALSEALELGIRLGLDPKTLSEIINSSSGRSWASELYNPVPGVLETTPATNNYDGGFAARLMTKDLGLAIEEAKKVCSSLPTGQAAYNLYNSLPTEMKVKDFSTIFRYLQNVKV